MEKHPTIKFTQIITKKIALVYSQLIQDNKFAIIINLRSYNLHVVHCHSYNKRKRENSHLLTSNEAISEQGKGRRSRATPKNSLTQWIRPLWSSWQLLLWQKLGCDLKHNLKLSKFPKFENSKGNIKILTEGLHAYRQAHIILWCI